MTQLDYSLESPEERTKLVAKIVESTPPSQLTNKYKEILANYIIFAISKKEKKERKILTENRLVTVNKRETSYEALVDKLENGEDGIYNLMHENKNTLLSPKNPITPQDIQEIPHLKTLIDAIATVESQAKAAIGKGKKAFSLKQTVIEMRQDQYVIRNGAKIPAKASSLVKTLSRIDLPEEVFLDEDGEVQSTARINLYNYKHVSALLCHYSLLVQELWDQLHLDMRYLMMDLEDLVLRALAENHPLLLDLLIDKIDNKSNKEIQEHLNDKYGVKHSLEYLSSLWRNKIPKLISEQAKRDWLIWHYTYEEKGQWKKCGRCGEIKVAHGKFFSKNKTSKDGYYSICKACRNKKGS